MYIQDIKKEFFDVVVGGRVLVLVNTDVDSVCATRILQYLFKCEHVLYTILPISGKKDLYTAFNTQTEGVKYLVLINCGATIDLYDFLEPDKDLTIFVADNHRPVDVTNIYNDGQIRLVMRQDPEDQIPEYEDIFRDDSSDEEEDESGSEDEFGQKKRRKFDDDSMRRRRERREWEEKRNRILFDYTQYSYYGSSTAILMYELSWKMSRDSNDLLWWAIVGHTELFLSHKIEDDRHLLDTGNLQNHVARLNSIPDSDLPKDVMKISGDRELNLSLYRHWTLFKALQHTAYTAMKFRTFSLKGEDKLQEFLADLGIPLSQAKQNWCSMDFSIRQDVITAFNSKAEKYGLDQIFYNSFNCSFGFRHKFCAADIVRAVIATLEHGDKGLDVKQSFFSALDALARVNVSKLENSINLARQQHEAIVKHAQNILDTKQVVSAGPVLYTIIREGTPNAVYVSRPAALTCLAQFILQGHIASSKNKKVTGLPLVLVAPLDDEAGLSVVVGIPPYNDKSRKNLFGKAFDQAVRNNECRYLIDYWDSSLIQIKTEDRGKFLDGLISMLS